MRPRYLEIEGLQSFKEQQHIDFDKLSETGLFGIFGPTGSGKSTILDAITLALYGSVHRAAKGTQGIINTDMNGIKVAFTFDLFKGGIRKTYRVERQYKRKKDSDSSAEAKLVRLLEITGEQEYILADKHSDVNNFVIQLVGLKFEDFTRSVVLPQNKFQEFLLSPRGEKTKMLERIFYLEEYGKRLGDKFNREMAAIKNRLSNVEGALSTLGIASPEALIESERKMMEAQEHRRDCADKLKAAEQGYNVGMELHRLSKEQELLQQRLAEYNAKEAEINSRQQKLNRSDAANSLRPIIAAYKEAKTGYSESQTSLSKLQEKLQLLEAERAAAHTRYEQAAKLKETRLPELIKHSTMLQECQTMQQELDAIEKQLAAARKEYEEIKAHLEAAKQNAVKKTGEKDLLLQEVTALDKEADEHRVDNEYRKQIALGLGLEKDLQTQEAAMKKQREKLQELQKSLLECQDKYNHALMHLENKTKEQQRLQQEKALFEASRPISREQLAEKQSNIISMIEQQKHHTAAMLAKSLSKGEECPVCGSLEHPNPAVDDMPEHQDLQADISKEKEALSKASEEFAAWEQKLQQLEAIIKQQESHVSEAKIEESKLAVMLTGMNTAMQQEQQQQAELSKSYEALAISYNEMKQQQKVDSFIIEAEKISKRDERSQTLAAEQKQKRSRLDAAVSELQAILEKINEVTNELTNKTSEGKKLKELKEEKARKIAAIIGDKNLEQELLRTNKETAELEVLYKTSMEALNNASQALEEIKRQGAGLQSSCNYFKEKLESDSKQLEEALKLKGFESQEEAEACMLTEDISQLYQQEILKYHKEKGSLEDRLRSVAGQLGGRFVNEEQWQLLCTEFEKIKSELEKSISEQEAARSSYMQIKQSFEKWLQLQEELKSISKRKDLLEQIQRLLKGNAFIEFISEERMRYIAREASITLGDLTKFRYSIELDSENGFVIRDNANGGVLRSVASLSGGETFLTSLSLALALSSQLQLKGQSPLEFFFLDEGFGTLDNALLDTVIDSLERLSSSKRVIGLISHVPEMKNRITRRLIIDAPDRAGKGSRISIEKA